MASLRTHKKKLHLHTCLDRTQRREVVKHEYLSVDKAHGSGIETSVGPSVWGESSEATAADPSARHANNNVLLQFYQAGDESVRCGSLVPAEPVMGKVSIKIDPLDQRFCDHSLRTKKENVMKALQPRAVSRPRQQRL